MDELNSPAPAGRDSRTSVTRPVDRWMRSSRVSIVASRAVRLVAGRVAPGRRIGFVPGTFMDFSSSSGDQCVISPWPTRSRGKGLVIEVRTTA